MKFKATVLIGLLAMAGQSYAAPSINDMQSCQALIDFIDGKLSSAPAAYPASDVKLVRSGLEKYNVYIQDEIVSPGLLDFNGGDAAKAKAMQGQVDAYKATLVAGYNNRYKSPGLFTDHAVAVNECAKKAVPKGQALEDLKVSLETMVKLAQIK